MRFGQEILALDSWCRKKQYDAFCQVSFLGHIKQEIMKLISIFHVQHRFGSFSEVLKKLIHVFSHRKTETSRSAGQTCQAFFFFFVAGALYSLKMCLTLDMTHIIFAKAWLKYSSSISTISSPEDGSTQPLAQMCQLSLQGQARGTNKSTKNKTHTCRS